jgi:hypothetical protein
VTAVPKSYTGEIQVNDEVIVHHNLFRRWYNAHGIENNSSGYYKEDQYFVGLDQMYLYKRKNKWKPLEGFCFVKPIESNSIIEKEQPHRGIIKYVDKNLKGIQEEDLVGFTPSSKYEFIINGERLYRVFTKYITIKYERQGTEREYNPSWL